MRLAQGKSTVIVTPSDFASPETRMGTAGP
jgi:hypothetical protein